MRSYCPFVARASGRSSPAIPREIERDAAVFGGVRGGEKAGVVAVLHVFAVGFEHARVCAGLLRNFAQHRQIKPERVAEAETFGEPGGVDVHDHVNQRLHLGGFACFSDEANLGGKLFQNRFGFSERVFAFRRTSDRACLRAPA